MASRDECGKPDTTEIIQARVPPFFTVLKRIGEEDALSGGCFLCVPKRHADKSKDPEYLRPYLCVVKVANGVVTRSERNGRIDVKTSQDCIRDEIAQFERLAEHERFINLFERSTGAEDDQNPWIAMHAVHGYSVQDWYEHRQRASPALVWHFAVQLATAILFLHHGVSPESPDNPPKLLPSFHGDLRSPNVMLDMMNRDRPPYPNVVIIDFGSSDVSSLNTTSDTPPDPSGFSNDLKSLCTLVHTLAHDFDPLVKGGYDGICACTYEEDRDSVTIDLGCQDTLIKDMWKILVPDTEQNTDDRRKTGLLDFIKLASSRLESAAARERAAERLISGEDMIQAVEKPPTYDSKNVLTERVFCPGRPSNWECTPPPSPPRLSASEAARNAAVGQQQRVSPGKRRFNLGELLRRSKVVKSGDSKKRAVAQASRRIRQAKQAQEDRLLMVGHLNVRTLRPRN